MRRVSVVKVSSAFNERIQLRIRIAGFARQIDKLAIACHSAPGFLATPADHEAVRALSSALFEGSQPAAHFVRDPGNLAATISPLVAADVSLRPTTPDIGVVHRRGGDVDIYFVANTSNEPRDVEARFRTPWTGAEWWDHVHGTTTMLSRRSR